ncbi:MAG: RsmE family RNA methyltransferase [Verrucomicrobiota bacterium]
MAGFRSFLYPGSTVEADALVLDGRESHHLVRVLRAKVGTAVEVLDGAGKRYAGTIQVADAKAVRIGIDSVEEVTRAGPRLRVVQSLSKGKAMDLILKMATEIGASEIQPVFTDQGEVQIKGERLASKVEKWRLTMIEACKQCGLPFLPKLAVPVVLKDYLAAEAPSSLRIVASLEVGSRPLREVLYDDLDADWVEIAIGPEGDFSVKEYALLRSAGYRSARLGANILRAETATAYMLSVIDQLRS